MRLVVGVFACLLAAPASAVTVDWVRIRDPGNAPDTATNSFAANCGSVGHPYLISKYEVTNPVCRVLERKGRGGPAVPL